MKLNLHPKGIPKQEPLGADTPLKKGGVVVGMRKEGDKEKVYFVGDDCHLLCVGATRSGKSRCLVLESICLLGLAGESIFCSDPKAELFHYTADFLKKLGYEVLVLDFKNPEKSMRYNLLQPIIDAISEGDTDRAEMLAWDLTNNLVGKPEGEKIWTNGECSIIAAAILCVVCDNQKRPEFQNMTNVYWFISEMCRTIGNKMPLLEYVKKLSPSHPARALLSISDVAPSRTRGSFYTSALTTLRLFTSKSIYAITHTSDFTLADCPGRPDPGRSVPDRGRHRAAHHHPAHQGYVQLRRLIGTSSGGAIGPALIFDRRFFNGVQSGNQKDFYRSRQAAGGVQRGPG